jgi:hypothetical protein
MAAQANTFEQQRLYQFLLVRRDRLMSFNELPVAQRALIVLLP